MRSPCPPLSVWIIAEEDSSGLPLFFSSHPSLLCFRPLFVSPPLSQEQFSCLPRSHVSFSSPTPHPLPPPLVPTFWLRLRMSCEEAQLHKERLQALAVSLSLSSFFLSVKRPKRLRHLWPSSCEPASLFHFFLWVVVYVHSDKR